MEREIVMFFVIDAMLVTIPLAYWYIKAHARLNKKSLAKAFRDLGLYRQSATVVTKNAIIILATLLLASAFLTVVFSSFGLNDTSLVEKKIVGLTPGIIAYLVFVRSSAEEIFFRGFLVKKTGIVVSSAIFSIAHYGYGSVAEVIGAFSLGLILAWNFKKNGCLIPNIVAHILYNSILCFAIYAQG